MRNKRMISALLAAALVAGMSTATAASTNDASQENEPMVSSSETGGIWGQIETFFQDILSIFSLNSATDTDSSAPTQAPSTPTQLPATPTELPSTPTELPSTPTQIPATPTEYPDNEHPTIDDNDDRTAGTQDKRTEPDWSVRGGGDIPAGEDDISLNTNTNPSTGR